MAPTLPAPPARTTDPDEEGRPVAESRDAFAALFDEEHPRIVAMVLALSGDRQHAEDVAQEALLRTYRRWDVVSRYERPGAWTRRVALNLATSARRRRRSEGRAVLRLATRPTSAPTDPVGQPVVDADLWAVVRSLPPQQARAIVLHYLADESLADMAVTLGCTAGTAKAHLHQARRALARRLDRPDPGETP